MKYGYRKPSIKKSIKARTTGKIKRATNSAINPFYGKKGMGYINDPKKAIYNKIYNKTTFGTSDILKKIDNNNNNNNKEGDIKMENKNKEENATNKKNKKFFKDKKNIAITILSILLFCVLCAYTAPPVDTTQYESRIKDLENQITQFQDNNKQLETEKINLEQEKNKLEEDKKTLEEQKSTLENEKQELTQKVEELAKAKEDKEKATAVAKVSQPSSSQTSTSSKTSTTSTQKNSTTSSVKNSSSTPVTPAKTSSSVQANTGTNTNNSQTVWVGDTGTKYHVQSCRTLKGNGHAITMQQALAEGRQACKVCH